MDEIGYLNLLSEVLNNGELRNTRNGNTLSIFGPRLEFNLKDQFPLITTKKMFIKGIFSELLWFKGEKEAAIFIGLWVPSILGFAIFLKLINNSND